MGERMPKIPPLWKRVSKGYFMNDNRSSSILLLSIFLFLSCVFPITISCNTISACLQEDQDRARTIAVDPSGNVYVSGSTAGMDGFPAIAVVKYGPDGELTWAKEYREPDWAGSYAGSVAADDVGNLYAVGTSRKNNGEEAITTLKYDPLGELIWAKQFPQSSGRYHNKTVVAEKETGGGGIFTAGCVESGGREYVSILRYDSKGNILQAKTFPASRTSLSLPEPTTTISALSLGFPADAQQGQSLTAKDLADVPAAGTAIPSSGPFVNPLHSRFGAVGDGINDDGPAICAAAATGYDVILEPGKTYFINLPITFTNGLIGHGSGYQSSSQKIKIVLGPGGKLIFDSGSRFANLYIESLKAPELVVIKDRFVNGMNFTISGGGKVFGQTGMRFQSGEDGDGCSNSAANCHLQNFWIFNLKNGFLFTGSGKYGYTTSSSIQNGYIHSCEAAFRMENRTNGAFSANILTGLYLEALDYAFNVSSFPSDCIIQAYCDSVRNVFQTSVTAWATNTINIEKGGNTIDPEILHMSGGAVVDGFTVSEGDAQYVWLNNAGTPVKILSRRALKGSMFNQQSGLLEVGLNGVYGQAYTYTPKLGGIIALHGVRLHAHSASWNGETLTVRIIQNYHDGTSSWVEKTFTADPPGTIAYLGYSDLGPLYHMSAGTDKVVTSVSVQARQSSATAAIQCTAAFAGWLN